MAQNKNKLAQQETMFCNEWSQLEMAPNVLPESHLPEGDWIILSLVEIPDFKDLRMEIRPP